MFSSVSTKMKGEGDNTIRSQEWDSIQFKQSCNLTQSQANLNKTRRVILEDTFSKLLTEQFFLFGIVDSFRLISRWKLHCCLKDYSYY